MKNSIFLLAANLDIGYNGMPILENINVTLPASQFIAILGRNGIGKTTLLNTIAGVIPSIRGEISLFGQHFITYTSYKASISGLRFLPDNKGIFKSLTVGENLDISMKKGYFNLNMLFELFPALASRKRLIANSLSGGEQQMLGIVQNLISNPKILLIDELSEGLQPDLVTSLIDFLIYHKSKNQLCILFVEQRMKIAKKLCDDAIILDSSIHNVNFLS